MSNPRVARRKEEGDVIRIILAFLQVSPRKKNLEWETSDGRTFQILGSYADQIGAYWERFFPPNDHPYRRPLTWVEAQAAFEAAVEPLILYSLYKDESEAEQLTREQVLDRVEQMFPGFRANTERRSP